ncbi:hypothetical protein GCM10010174_73960 [Kutzneria viridogrisea]|uniref:Response regulatory domain-containing protein n=2 Tax=Kutzneria TaxID=43356 RepID=W5W8S3_9PSEU|nr:hypothetical protein [Kutzneria albida]AHH96946.1 hypothetical protein KALB_3582 [Kutzneria albida DSM 43870]MBA8932089.1 hypothetical protein [Kutzneria viridogrisea]
MHVLVTEQIAGDCADLVHALRELGCVVSTCHDAGGVCTAMSSARRCPLDGEPRVDLLVDVRAGGTEMTVREFGAICAARAELPVMLVAPERLRRPTVPWGLHGRATAVRMSALLDACARTLHARSARRGTS